MLVTIYPSKISGNITAAASKSSMQRACALALLHEGETVISNPGKSNDDNAALDVIQKLGASLKFSGDQLTISSKGINQKTDNINCGESGLGLRMFAPIAALSPNKIIINGSGSLLQRPMDFFDEIFPLLQIEVNTNKGKLPVIINGPLQPANITIDGSSSSQFLTGLMIAYAKACTSPTTIKVKNLKSKPYIDLTLKVMKHFGWEVVNKNYEEFHFTPNNNQVSSIINYTVEGDWSGAAFLLVAGAFAGNITVNGLDVFSPQADKKILEAISNCGASLSVSENEIVVSSLPLKAFHFDATDCPDLFPPLVALASYCKGKTVIKGVSRLAHKESNRGLTLQQEFAKMGVIITLQDDLMIIEGNNEIKGANVSSRHDHRIAMACAVAALGANGSTSISDAEAIEKSYPDFYNHLQKLNALLQKT